MSVDSAGGVLMYLGRCCDMGAVVATGELWNGDVRGAWEKETLGGGPRGRFRMVRIP